MSTFSQVFALASAAVALALPSGVWSADAPQRPNIVFIICDDLRWDELGCTGHPKARTPNIDRIAKEGVLFRNCFCTTPLCSPSRASFLTGLYPHTHKVINNDKIGLSEISHTLVTFPRLLRDAGYETALIGKWHMGLDDSRRPGFDRWLSFKGQGLYVNPVFNDDGLSKQMDGYTTDLLNAEAVAFIEKRHTRPFLLYLGHKAVHYPFLPAKRHEKLYADWEYTPPPSAKDDFSGKPALARHVDKVDVLRIEGATPEPAEPRRGRGTSRTEVLRDHLRCLAAVDEGVGQILAALEKTGQLNNTLVVFTSDNGMLMGEHGQFNMKNWAYEEALRLPLLMRYPKLIPAGGKRDELVLSMDIAPTVLDLAGVKPFAELHGRSLLPLWKDRDAAWRNSFLAEYFAEKVTPRVPDWQAVRDQRWKYIHYPALKGMDELYDLHEDPHEMRNLIGQADAASKLRDMQAELQRLLKEQRGSRN